MLITDHLRQPRSETVEHARHPVRPSEPRVLIADDQPDVLEALRLLLKAEGFQLESASSPAGVLAAIEAREFDVALIDLNYARDTTSGEEGLNLLSRIQGIDPTLSFARAGESAMDRLMDNRKEILRMAGVRAGGPASYPQCAGAGVPLPPPPRGSTSARLKRADVHAGCPRTSETYLTVGLPIHGQPEGLKNARDTRGRRVSVRGDVWTILVDSHSIGPEGWSSSQYAWLFKRGRGNAPPELAATILIGVVE